MRLEETWLAVVEVVRVVTESKQRAVLGRAKGRRRDGGGGGLVADKIGGEREEACAG